MRISESADESCDEQRFSNGSPLSCLFPSFDSYDKLPQEPLGLIVLKLDGTSFGIEVDRTGTVGDIKRAVESTFSYLPEKGFGRVSWDHVWSQFCLCFDGQKLLHDSDCMCTFGIRDGDQLNFIRHTSNSCPESKIQQTDSDDDDQHRVSHRNDMEEDNAHRDDTTDDEDDGTVLCCQLKLTNLLRGGHLRRYRKLRIPPLKAEERRHKTTLWQIRNCFRFGSRNKRRFRKLNQKGE